MDISELELKKRLHIKSFQALIDWLRDKLIIIGKSFTMMFPDQCSPEECDLIVQSILVEANEMLDYHKNVPPMQYADWEIFTKMNHDIIDVKNFGISKLTIWPYHDPQGMSFGFIRKTNMRTCHRTLIYMLKRKIPLFAGYERNHDIDKEAEDALINNPNKDQICSGIELPGLVAQLILKMHHNICDSNELGETLLMQAVAEGAHPDLLKMLILAYGEANLNALSHHPEQQSTALFKAAQFGHTDCLQVLLQAGADIEIPNQDQATPLYVAAQNGHAKCIKILIDADANVNQPIKGGSTPLFVAAQNGYTKCIKTLIQGGADVMWTGREDGKTPLYIANHFGNVNCAKIIRGAMMRNENSRINMHKNDETNNNNNQNTCMLLLIQTC